MMEIQRIPASVFLLTFNSARTLPRALASVQSFEDILICDGGSTDDTLAVAREMGVRVVPQDSLCLDQGRLKDFACARNGALRHTAYPWVMFIDSDETASEDLIEEVRGIVASNPTPGAYRMPASIILDGRRVMHSSNYPGYQVRFFHKDTGSFRKPVHERFVVQDGYPTRTLQNPWHYYVERGTIREEFAKDIVRDMPLYRDRYAGASLGKRFFGTWRAGKSALGILLRGVGNAILAPGGSYPLSLEWLRIRYQGAIVRTIWGL